MNRDFEQEVPSLNRFFPRDKLFLSEHDLMIAILEDAFNLYTNRQKAKRRRWWWEARAWLFSTDENETKWLFSCESICDYLDIDRDALLSYLRRNPPTDLRPVKGVYWNKTDRRWRAYARNEAGERKYVGSFKQFKKARDATKQPFKEKAISQAA